METAMRNVSINDRNTPVQPEPDPDQPLDFSSRKNVTPKDDEVLRKASKDSAISLSEDDRLSPRPLSPQNTQSPQNGSADTHRSSLIGDPRMALPLNFPMPPVSMAGMGMPLMLPPHAMFPQGLMPPGFGPMWPNQMAAMMQQDAARKALNAAKFPTNILNHANAQRIKPTNGTKDNPMNGNLSAAMRNLPSMLPGMPPSLFNNPIMTDPNIFAEAVKSHEDMFNMYKQQVLNQKAAEDAKRVPRKSSAPCTLTFSSSTPPVSRPNPASQSHTNDTKDQNGKVHEPMDIPYLQESENLLNGNNGAQFPRSSSVTQSSDEGKSSSTESISKHQNSDSSHSSTNQLHSHLPHLNEVACSSEGRRSLTPAYSLNDDVMRPRSSTLPCKPAVTSLSNSPTPSLLSSGTTTPNKGSFRKRARTLPDEQKDEAYWERRRKNNEAAKRSRDSRRAKEDDIAIRAAFLEQENIRLRVELASLRQQTAKLRSELIIYQTPEEMNAENLSVEQS